ncbi:malonyl-ACP O-methyltransferase BioC [Paenibacillus sp. IHBB 10380]|uniref:malonyl-ACP O-methyltransferase BioC n=1 Tax=Paenibacillus sp. IHBB 10380 TaxID=1566358 RepID=UPI0005CFD7C7|nr:malonyl-ACP O-methyltransferase BioC [Paenibacillus sp. IHBB 10380]AJS58762.1 malonyl-CoA O-methyltransferase [Paenibacillus sp. IHBB 10380]
MNSKNSAIQRQFNRHARSYDAQAHIQRTMADRLTESLIGWKNKGFTDEPNILEIGCGTGALTEMLVNEWPNASITALDIASAMIEQAEQRVLSTVTKHLNTRQSATDRLRFLQADVEMWAAEAETDSFDLIVSNACFQWLSNPRTTLSQLRRILRSGGLLIFTTFGPDTFCELHQAFNQVYRASGMEPRRHGLSFQSITQWNNLLEETGFSNIQCEGSIQTEKYPTARDFLLSVKAMGASTSEAQAIRDLSPRRLFTSMYEEYEDKFSIQGGVAATYDLLFIQAKS